MCFNKREGVSLDSSEEEIQNEKKHVNQFKQ